MPAAIADVTRSDIIRSECANAGGVSLRIGDSTHTVSWLSAEGAVTLVFHGYDDDPRELEAIPEVRAWFAKLFEAWPYWSFFASRIDQTVPLVLSLLLSGEPGMVGWCFDLDELKPLLLELFGHQNERVTHYFLETVQAFFN